MRLKQKLAVFLTGTLLAGLLSGAAFAAAPKLHLELQFTPAGVGETAEAQLVCENNPGLASAQFTLAFDGAVLDCTDVSSGPVLRGMMAATNPDGEKGAIVAAASASGVERDGVLAYFEFTVLADGGCRFSLADTHFTMEDGTPVSFTVSGLEQTVEDQEPDSPAAPVVPEKPDEPGEPDVPAAPVQPDEPASGGTADAPEENQSEGVKISFFDIGGHWAEDYVMTAAERGLVNGLPDGGVHPDDVMTRAEFVTLLWRHAGKPKPAAPAAFTDLVPGAYYEDAVAWAQEVGYVNGVSSERFDPGGLISREMVVTVLHRIDGLKPGGEQIWAPIYDKGFADSAEVSDWAKNAVYWSVYNEILCGQSAPTVGNTLNPKADATRAEIMVMLIKYQDGIGGTQV